MERNIKLTNNPDNVVSFPGKGEKTSKLRSCLGYALLAALAVIVISLILNKPNFNSTDSVNTENIPLSNSNNFCFSEYKEGYILASDGKISCFNTNQTPQWAVNGSKTTPQIFVNKKYVLTYYPEDNRAVVTNGGKTSDIKTSGNVQYGYVNTNGYSVLFLDEVGLKNKISVYNNSGEMIYYRNNPDKYIVSAILSDNNKNLITTELITESSSVSSELVVTDVRKNKEISRVTFEKDIPCAIYMIDKNNIVCVFETGIICHNLKGKEKWKTDFNAVASRFAYDNGNFVFCFNSDDSANKGSDIQVYNKNGKKISSFTTNEKVHNVKVKDKSILLIYSRKLEMNNFKGKVISSTDMTYDMKDVLFLGNKKCALVISNFKDAVLLPLD